jgi:hypothetical protein
VSPASRRGGTLAADGWQLDHVFVMSPEGAPAADRLVEAGFEEGPPNRHPGQGTACRRFWFANAYVELLWVEDFEAAGSPDVAALGLPLRGGAARVASRIGIGLRRAWGSPHSAEPPIETQPVHAPYLPHRAPLRVAAGAPDPASPLVFFLPELARTGVMEAPGYDGSGHGGPAHPNGAREVTGVELALPGGGGDGPAVRWLAGLPGVRVERGPRERLGIVLDGPEKGRRLDFHPNLPLSVAW